MNKVWMLLVCGLAVAFLGSPAYGCDVIPDYDFDWVIIGDRGNPAFEGGAQGQLKGRGGIDYGYRLTRTEITVRQWFEFVQAFAPYYEGSYGQSIGLTGCFINIAGPLNDPDSYYIIRGTEDFPTNQSWRMAARYCNWLHNNKEETEEAFASGAYWPAPQKLIQVL